MDIAKLKVIIERSGVSTTINELKALANQAQSTETQTKKLGKSFVDVGGNVRNLSSNFYSFNGSLSSVESTVNAIKNSFKGLGFVVGGVVTVLTAGVAAFALMASQILIVGEKFSGVNARLKILTLNSEEYRSIQQKIFETAQQTRSSLENTIDLYTKVSRGTKELNLSEEQRLAITKTLNEASIVSGATNEEQANSLRQLMQALQGGVLRAEEFNSVNEQTPRVIQAVADGLGITTGEFRKMVVEGKVTSDILVYGIAAGAAKVHEEFTKMPPTIQQAEITLRNAWHNIIIGANESEGATVSLAHAIVNLAKTVDDNKGSIINAFTIIARSITSAVNVLGVFVTNYNKIAPYINSFREFGKNGGFQGNIVGGFKAGMTEYNNTIANEERNKRNAANASLPLQLNFSNQKLIPTIKPYSPSTGGAIGGGGRSSTASEANKLAESLTRVSQRLEEERLQIIANDEQYKIYNELKDAGLKKDAEIYASSITNGSIAQLSVQAQKIEDVIIANNKLKESIESLSNNNALFGLTSNKKDEQLNIYQELANGAKNLASGLGDVFLDMANGVEGVFESLLDNIIKMVAEIIIQYYIIKPLLSALGVSSGTGTGSVTASANGNVFSGGNVKAFASGGVFTNSIVSSPTLAPMAYFGEAGDEAIMPLTRIGGDLGVKAIVGGNNTPNIVFKIINNTGSKIEEKREESFDGENFVITTILSAVANNKGGTKDILKSQLKTA